MRFSPAAWIRRILAARTATGRRRCVSVRPAPPPGPPVMSPYQRGRPRGRIQR